MEHFLSIQSRWWVSVLLVWWCVSSVTPGHWQGWALCRLWGSGGGGQVLAARDEAAWQGVPISVMGFRLPIHSEGSPESILSISGLGLQG